MRKSIKLFMALAVIAMVAVSCQKEGQFNPSKKVKKITTTKSYKHTDGTDYSRTTSREYVWDGSLLTSVNAYINGEIAYISRYSYDNKKRLQQMDNVDCSTTRTYVYKYIYNGNKLDTIKETISGVVTAYWILVHDGGVISQIIYKYGESKSYAASQRADALFFLPEAAINELNVSMKENVTKGLGEYNYYLNYTNNNLTGYSYSLGSNLYKNEFTFDGKKNPLYGWFDVVLCDLNELLCKQNIASSTITVTEKDGKETKRSYQYQYEYNGSYPVSAISKCKEIVDYETVDVTYEQKYEY